VIRFTNERMYAFVFVISLVRRNSPGRHSNRLENSTQLFHDIQEGLIPARPSGDWFAIKRERLELTQRRGFPVAWFDNDRDDTDIACLVPL